MIPAAGGPPLSRLAFDDLPGWRYDALTDFWPAFLASAMAIAGQSPSLRVAMSADDALLEVARKALDVPSEGARAFVEAHFAPWRIDVPGFVTAYYEPIVAGSRMRSDKFAAPILARPRDLDAVSPYPDRRAIRTGAIAGQTTPVVWLRDAVEVFLIQVQGSARVSLEDGTQLRLVYDGRNGRPYTSIGRILVTRGEITPDAMSLAVLKAWLRANGAGAGGPADEVMDANQSYVFFRAEPVVDPARGPTGGQNLPLTSFRSIAIDRTVWPYGLPFWVRADLPAGPFRRLMVAQDTGSAIVGPARADLFFGSGEAAGDAAGLVRHAADLFVLLPAE